RNQKLSASELGMDKEAFDALDANHDGELDATELVKWASRPADLEMVARMGEQPKKSNLLLQPLLELAKIAKPESPLQLFEPNGRKAPLASTVKDGDGGMLLWTLNDTRVELRGNAGSTGNAAGVKQFYKQQFEALDQDKNGYLDRKEAEMDGNGFLRALYVLADRNGDGKLYE